MDKLKEDMFKELFHEIYENCEKEFVKVLKEIESSLKEGNFNRAKLLTKEWIKFFSTKNKNEIINKEKH